MAGTGLKPTITVTTEQNGRTGCMVEHILFNNRFLRRAEQGTTGTIVTDHIVGKINLRCPLQILDTVSAGLTDGGIDRLIKRNAELLCTMIVRLIDSFNRSYRKPNY